MSHAIHWESLGALALPPAFAVTPSQVLSLLDESMFSLPSHLGGVTLGVSSFRQIELGVVTL